MTLSLNYDVKVYSYVYMSKFFATFFLSFFKKNKIKF